MTVSTQENQVQDTKQSDKELNFRALEAKYQRQSDAQKAEIERLAQEKKELEQRLQPQEDDDDSEPYVDKKKLNKFGQNLKQSTQTDIQKAMEQAKYAAKEELKQEMWLENNPDFYDVLQHAEKFAQKAPELAKTILRMPEGFERQKLVYQNIKTLGMDKPEPKQQSIQDKVDANRRSPYYQPSGIAAAPYNVAAGDFSDSGQKNAYEKMIQLKKSLRI